MMAPVTTDDETMPPTGTTERCWFCRAPVTLGNDGGASGWYYWAAAGEPADGVRRCYGGEPVRHNGNVVTLHLPEGRAWMYDHDGHPMSPRGIALSSRKTA